MDSIDSTAGKKLLKKRVVGLGLIKIKKLMSLGNSNFSFQIRQIKEIEIHLAEEIRGAFHLQVQLRPYVPGIFFRKLLQDS